MDTIMEYKRKGERPKLEVYVDPRKNENKIESTTEEIIIKSDISRDNKIPKPPFWGSRIVEDIPLEKAFEYINEVALFRGSWNVYKDRNKADSEYDKLINEEIIPKFNELKLQAKREQLLSPKVIYGYYPCKSEDNSLIVYKPKNIAQDNLYAEWEVDINTSEMEKWVTFKFPRQRTEKHLCISDFFKSEDSDVFDVVPFMIVTVGEKATEYAQKLYDNNQYQDYLYFHGLSVETAEGLAEYWHKIVRRELGIDKKDSTDTKKLFQQGYQGSRYSFGYPACPNLEDNKYMFELLKPERIGITLTEEWQMVPEQTTNAIIVHHPKARYFFIK